MLLGIIVCTWKRMFVMWVHIKVRDRRRRRDKVIAWAPLWWSTVSTHICLDFFPQPTSPFHSVLALLMSCFVSACNAAHYNKNLCVEKLKWSRNCWCWEDEKTREEKHCSCFLFSCSIASDHYGFYDDINIIYLAQGHSWMTFKLSSIFPSKL